MAIQGVKYEKRGPRPAGTSKNPTIASLMSQKDQSDFVSITMPKTATPFDIACEPIRRNNYPPFMPGKTYRVHPIIAEDLQQSIKDFENSVYLQMSKRNKDAQRAGILSAEEALRPENMQEVS